MKKIIHLICAARPNFMKIAPVFKELTKAEWCDPRLIHTGQHYDDNMSGAFFRDFELPDPHYHLGVGSGTHSEQVANTMLAYEKLYLNDSAPDLVVVVGDVNATLACSLVAKKLQLKVAHLEAGLRSFDNSMPEEINRIATDAISDLLLTPSEDADKNLEREGVRADKIFRVGNIMIDSYCLMAPKIQEAKTIEKLDLSFSQYGVLTLHRPSNVDSPETLSQIIEAIGSSNLDYIFPVHPRTQGNLQGIQLPKNIHCIEPLGYIDFMSLVQSARSVITDSGGLQEETTYLGIPCFTLRPNTERPITIELGTNQLVTPSNLKAALTKPKSGKCPPLWEGKTAERVVKVLKDAF